MSELYKAIAGSPITYLAADISANQTTISITDDSALPDAPNICTIGYGENIETIRYGAKSNGVLQNVTRGIEGTPRAWPAGTEVARFFTAYDHNSIIENFNSHLAEYSALGKIEYVYIPEGTQTRFDVPLRTSLFFVLTENNNNKTTIINVARFASGGLVYQTVVSGTAITIHTNADKSAVFLTPTFSVRGFVVRAIQPI